MAQLDMLSYSDACSVSDAGTGRAMVAGFGTAGTPAGAGGAGGPRPRPSPNNFAEYVPWACHQLGIEQDVYVCKLVQSEYVSTAASKGKHKGKKRSDESDQEPDEKMSHHSPAPPASDRLVRIVAVHDAAGELLRVQFAGGARVPRAVLQVLGLVLRFHPRLHALSAGAGLDRRAARELSRLLPLSHLTDLCLDGCAAAGVRFDSLLERENRVRHLSLSRCGIDDDALKNLFLRLLHPLPASRTLVALNLSSNRITDVGAECVAEVLRTNAKLAYLNVAGNMLTDAGAAAVLDVLREFRLTSDEARGLRARYIAYLKRRNDMMTDTIHRLKSNESERRHRKKAAKGVPLVSAGKRGKTLEAATSINDVDVNYREKAEHVVTAELGAFRDPFDSSRTVRRDGAIYSYGNNTINYLNLAYNNLTFVSLKKLLDVLMYQKVQNGWPQGLVNVCIEGNRLPAACLELTELQQLLEAGLSALNPRPSLIRRARAVQAHKKL